MQSATNAFVRHFRQLVIPKLQKIVQTQGFFLAFDLADYSEAYAAVWDVAIKLGVSQLRDDLIDDVRAWIDEELWQAFEKFDADVEDYRRTVVDPVADDIRKWECKLACHLRQKEGVACQTTTTTET